MNHKLAIFSLLVSTIGAELVSNLEGRTAFHIREDVHDNELIATNYNPPEENVIRPFDHNDTPLFLKASEFSPSEGENSVGLMKLGRWLVDRFQQREGPMSLLSRKMEQANDDDGTAVGQGLNFLYVPPALKAQPRDHYVTLKVTSTPKELIFDTVSNGHLSIPVSATVQAGRLMATAGRALQRTINSFNGN